MDLRSTLVLLDDHGVDHVVLGGFAALLPGAAPGVFTLDLVPAAAPANLERLTAALLELELHRDHAPGDEPIPLWRGFLATGRVPGQVSLGNGPEGLQIAMRANVAGSVGIDHATLSVSALQMELPDPVPLTVTVANPELLASLRRPGYQLDLFALQLLLGPPDPIQP